MDDDLEEYLALLPGPRGENAELLRRFSATIVDDHLHWRRNYYPDDPAVITASQRLRLADAGAGLEQHLEVLLARLRRSFPFHSPRYVAHQQSELSLAALAGGLVGTLYNANNVTTESGNVTVEVEIEAASALLEMIGYEPPPALPGPDAGREAYEKFREKSSGDYGWCHLTSGGTAANIEALWVARNVTYQAAWVAQLCQEEDFDLAVTPSGATAAVKLAALDRAVVLNLPPSVSVRLLTDLYAEATRREKEQGGDQAGRGAPKRVWDRLQKIARDKPLPVLLAASPPAVFVTGARHYSLDKAAELLGLGAGAVVHVGSDSRHRMDVADLEAKIRQTVKQGRTPLAVVAIIGTTEEGAVDPLSDILALRTRLEAELGVSFWVHADAAWGGYLATLGHPPASEGLRLKAAKLLAAAGLAGPPAPRSGSWVGDVVGATLGSGVFGADVGGAARQLIAAIETRADDQEDRFEEFLSALNSELAKRDPAVCLDGGFEPHANPADMDLLVDQQVGFLQASTTRHLAVPGGTDKWGPEQVPLAAMDPDVLRAVSALRWADSVTVDPHKMGYQPYACGAVAFRDDRCRAYVHQKAPYLTRFDQNIARQPLTHAEPDDQSGGFKVITESHGAFTLEGSRPSAQATGLWLATKVLPLDQDHHGRLVRDSWRAARQLYGWLCDWDRVERKVFCSPGAEPAFRFVVWTATNNGEPAPPDTNLVIFGLVPTAEATLAGYRRLTGAVYKKFSIAAERGEHQHSYSQPFFLSNTRFVAEDYPLASLSATARRAGISDFDEEYPKTVAGDEENYGVQVLRATVMNPYLFALQKAGRGDLLRDLVAAMAEVARAEARPGAAPTGGPTGAAR